MKVGFTGTRHGMTDEQRRAFIARAKEAGVTEFHYGVCDGADEDAWDVFTSARDLGFERPRTVAHPPSNPAKRLHNTMPFDDEVRPEAEYLTRNRNIVDASETLWAAPDGPEERRSGTWATVRYARRVGKPVVVFWPDGSVTEG